MQQCTLVDLLMVEAEVRKIIYITKTIEGCDERNNLRQKKCLGFLQGFPIYLKMLKSTVNIHQ